MRVLLISFVLLLGFTGCNRNKSDPTKTIEAKITEAESTVQKIESSIQETEEKLQLAEQQIQENPQSEEAQRELTELQEALAKAKEEQSKAQEALTQAQTELAEAQQRQEEAQTPVTCARQVEESEYPCSEVCADIRKIHEAFQRYFYCMESNNYVHNMEAKSCWDTYNTEYNQAGNFPEHPTGKKFHLIVSLKSFSQAENMGFAGLPILHMSKYHNQSPDSFRRTMYVDGALFFSDGDTRRGLCSDFDDSSFTGEDFLKCAKKIIQYYVDENNRRLNCW